MTYPDFYIACTEEGFQKYKDNLKRYGCSYSFCRFYNDYEACKTHVCIEGMPYPYFGKEKEE